MGGSGTKQLCVNWVVSGSCGRVESSNVHEEATNEAEKKCYMDLSAKLKSRSNSPAPTPKGKGKNTMQVLKERHVQVR